MPKVPIGDVFRPPNLAEQMDMEDDEDGEATIKRLENKYPELHLRIEKELEQLREEKKRKKELRLLEEVKR